MRTELASLIVVKQEFPDFRINGNSISENGEENNNNFPNIKSENDCNNNRPEDYDSLSVKKSKKNFFFIVCLSTNTKNLAKLIKKKKCVCVLSKDIFKFNSTNSKKNPNKLS
jgi:hypothetical protein